MHKCPLAPVSSPMALTLQPAICVPIVKQCPLVPGGSCQVSDTIFN